MSYPAQGEWFNTRRWDRAEASVRDVGGPSRVVTDQPDPNFKPRPVGFTAHIEPVEADPLTWDGDGA